MVILGELRFEFILRKFELLRRPIGKGIYCCFLATFFVSEKPQAHTYILNIIVLVSGLAYICIGLFCKKKKDNEVVPTSS